MDNRQEINFKVCSSNFLYNTLQNNRNCSLVFDLRDTQQSEQPGKILGSIRLRPTETDNAPSKEDLSKASSFNLLTLIDQPLTQRLTQRVKSIKRNFCFLIISDESLTSPFDSYEDGSKLISQDKLIAPLQTTKFTQSESLSVMSGLKIYKELRSQKVPELYILGEGFKHFASQYPFLVHKIHEESQTKGNLIYFIQEAKLFCG